MPLAGARLCAGGRELLRQPSPAVSTGDGCGEWLRLAQERAQVVPYQGIELAGRGVARGAAGGAVREGAVALAVAQVVEVPPVGGSCRAGQAAMAAAHQGA